jgi:hypothetical protein
MARTKKKKVKVAVAVARATANDQRYSHPPTPSAAHPMHFSLQDAARNTGTHASEWSRSTKLRHQGVAFVSAGPKSPLGDEKGDASTIDASCPVHNEPTLGSDILPNLSSNANNLFVIDTQGQHPRVPPITSPVLPSTSGPASDSDSDGEVLFQGRNNASRRVVDDPVVVDVAGSEAEVADFAPLSASLGAAVAENTTAKASATSWMTPQKRWNDGEVPWVHRSKPGYGWAAPRSQLKQASQSSRNIFILPNDPIPAADTAALPGYVEDSQAQADHSGADSDLDLTVFKSRALDIQLQGNVSDSNDSEEDDGVCVQRSYMPRIIGNGETDNADSEDGDDGEDEDDEDDEDEDDDSILDDLDLIERKMARLSDEKIARLLAKQKGLGIPSDELLLFDDDDDIDDDGALEAAVAGEAQAYTRNRPKSARRAKKVPTFAGESSEPPYDDFDIMDFDRPSLKARKKGKLSGQPNLENLSDPDLIEQLMRSWETDRARKKSRKEEREALRSQGLLGKGKKDNKADLMEKYNEGMSINEIKQELETFLNSSHER